MTLLFHGIVVVSNTLRVVHYPSIIPVVDLCVEVFEGSGIHGKIEFLGIFFLLSNCLLEPVFVQFDSLVLVIVDSVEVPGEKPLVKIVNIVRPNKSSS